MSVWHPRIQRPCSLSHKDITLPTYLYSRWKSPDVTKVSYLASMHCTHFYEDGSYSKKHCLIWLFMWWKCIYLIFLFKASESNNSKLYTDFVFMYTSRSNIINSASSFIPSTSNNILHLGKALPVFIPVFLPAILLVTFFSTLLHAFLLTWELSGCAWCLLLSAMLFLSK